MDVAYTSHLSSRTNHGVGAGYASTDYWAVEEGDDDYDDDNESDASPSQVPVGALHDQGASQIRHARFVLHAAQGPRERGIYTQL